MRISQSSVSGNFKRVLMAAIFVASTATVHGEANSSEQKMPSNEQIFGYVQDLIDFGPRRTGSEANRKTADYLAAKFKEFGLSDIAIEQGDSMQWEANRWGITVNGADVPSFYMRHTLHPGNVGPFSTGPNGLNAEIVYVGDATDLSDFDVKGKIVVADMVMTERDMKSFGASASLVNDPEGKLAESRKIDPFTPKTYPENFGAAMKGGAVGFIGILTNYFDSNRFYNEDLSYFVGDDLHFSIPGFWVTATEGEKLKALAKTTKATARLTLEGEVKNVRYRTVVGRVAGEGDETVMIQSHHDSGFAGAVEDASGTAEVLALAKYYSQRQEKPKRNLMFVLMDTHFTGYEAHDDFVERHMKGSGNKNIVANVTVEHIAREVDVVDGKAILTDDYEPRILITSPSLIKVASDAVLKHDFRKSLVVSTKVFAHSEGIPTDVGTIQKATGIPVVSLLTAPTYLYDISDTLDKVAVDQLQPTAEMLSDVIDRLSEMPIEQLEKDRVNK